jgi:hypothetical protein
MKTFISILAFAFASASLSAQSTQTRQVGDFTGIKTSSIIEVVLTQGDSCSVSIETADIAQNNVKTEVKDGVLVLSAAGVNNTGEIRALVTVKNLRSLEVDGTSSVKTTNQLITDSLVIDAAGASGTRLDVKAAVISAKVAGASQVKLLGTADRLYGKVSGASALKAYQLSTVNADVETSGASSAHVSASASLKADASGASEIHYTGNPADKQINATGASSVSMRDTDKSSKDTTNLHMGAYDVNVINNEDDDDDDDKERSKRERHADDDDFEFWSGIDFGVNGLLTSKNEIELPTGLNFLELNYGKSYVFGVNAFQKNIHIYRNNVNLGTGIGLTWYHYNFRNSYSLRSDTSYASAVFDSLNYSKNRLNICYVNIPLFLEFNTNNSNAERSFHIGAGMQFGYNLFNNKLKQKYELDGRTYKRKIKDDFNVNPFRYDIIARVGYGNYTIFGTYSLSTLFEKNKGPVLYPFAAGINIHF